MVARKASRFDGVAKARARGARMATLETARNWRGCALGRAATAPAARAASAKLSAAITGDAAAEQWGLPTRKADFHDLKGDLESVAALAGATLEFRPSQAAHGHPGRSADIYRDGARIGWIGQLHPRLQRQLDLDADVVAFELDLAPLTTRVLPRAAGANKQADIAVRPFFGMLTDRSWFCPRPQAGQNPAQRRPPRRPRRHFSGSPR